MTVIFADAALETIYETGTTTDSRYKKFCKNRKLVEGYRRAVVIMLGVESTEGLRDFSYLHYEKLKYQKDDPKSSVRIANGSIERLIFREMNDGIVVELIEIDSTHYGNKK